MWLIECMCVLCCYRTTASHQAMSGSRPHFFSLLKELICTEAEQKISLTKVYWFFFIRNNNYSESFLICTTLVLFIACLVGRAVCKRSCFNDFEKFTSGEVIMRINNFEFLHFGRSTLRHSRTGTSSNFGWNTPPRAQFSLLFNTSLTSPEACL